MASYKVQSGNVIVSGYKYDYKGNPVVGCYVDFYDPTGNVILDRTSTDENGAYALQVPVASVPIGTYQVRFYESGVRRGLPPNGDWEEIFVNPTEVGPPDMTPRTSITFSGTANGVAAKDQPNESGWWNGNVTVTLAAPASYNGHSPTMYYRVYTDPSSRGAWLTYSVPFTMTTDGAWYVEFYSKYGPSTIESSNIARVNLDKTAPTWAPVQNSITGGYGRVVLSLDGAHQPADSGSGIARIDILRQFNGSATVAPVAPAPTFLKIEPAPVTAILDSQVSQAEYPWYYAVVTDKAGNASGLIQLNSTSALSIPFEPADVAGALGLADYHKTASERSVRYGVPVQLRKIYFNNGSAITIDSVGYSQTALLSGAVTFTPITAGITLDGVAYTCGTSIPAGDHVLDLASPIANAYAVALISSGATFGALAANITDFRVSTFLAADEMDAGRIRVEQGISISKGGTTGVFIDNNGILVKDTPSTSVIQLNNVADGDGYFAKVAGWGVGQANLAKLDGSNNGIDIRISGASALQNGIVIHADADGSYHSAVRVKVAGVDKAVLGYLGTDWGVWGKVGGFGGTGDYSTAPVKLGDSGVIMLDSDGTARVTLGTPQYNGMSKAQLTTVGIITDYTSANTNPDFESAVGAEWTITAGVGGSLAGDNGRTNAQAQTGSYSYKLSVTTGMALIKPSAGAILTWGWLKRPIALSGSGVARNYAVECYVRNGTPVTTYDSIAGIEVYSDSGYTTLITSSTVSISNGSTAWQKISVAFNTTAATVYIRAILATKAGYAMSTNLSAYFDNFTVYATKSAVELSSSGLWLFNSMNSYIQQSGSGPISLVGVTMDAQDVIIRGKLTVLGGMDIAIPAIAATPADYDATDWNAAYSHSTDVTGGVHGATSAATNNMIVRRDGSAGIAVGAIAAALITAAGLIFSAHNTYDVGAAGASSPRDVYVGRNLYVGGDLNITGALNAVSATLLQVDDILIKVNNGGNDASSEGAGIQVARTGTAGSIIYANAAATKWKVGGLGAEVEVADISTAQTFTNKTWQGIAVADAYIANSAHWNTAYTHSQDVTGADHGATSAATANMIVRRDSNGATTLSGLTVNGTTPTGGDTLTTPFATETNGNTLLHGSIIIDLPFLGYPATTRPTNGILMRTNGPGRNDSNVFTIGWEEMINGAGCYDIAQLVLQAGDTDDSQYGPTFQDSRSIYVKGGNAFENSDSAGGHVYILPGYNKGYTGNLHNPGDVIVALYGGRLGVGKMPSLATLDISGTLALSGAASLSSTLGVTGVATFNNNVGIATGKYIGTAFTQGTFGAGWIINQNVTVANQSYLEIDNLSVRGTLYANIFQKNVIKATNGMLFVSDSTNVLGDGAILDNSNAPQGDRIRVKEPNFAQGDIIQVSDLALGAGLTVLNCYIRWAEQWEIDTNWAGHTNLESDGAGGFWLYYVNFDASTHVYSANATLVRVGNTGDANRQGAIFMDASTFTGHPILDIYDGRNTTATVVPKVRLGYLGGITDADLGGTLSGYGLYGQNVYLKGGIVATFGKIAGWTLSAAGIYKNSTTGGVTSGVSLASDDGLSGHTPFLSFYGDSSGGQFITLGGTVYDGAWHTNKWGMVIRTNGDNLFAVYSDKDGTNRVASISGWNFDVAKLYKVTSGVTTRLQSNGNTGTSGNTVTGLNGLGVNDGSADRVLVGDFTMPTLTYTATDLTTDIESAGYSVGGVYNNLTFAANVNGWSYRDAPGGWGIPMLDWNSGGLSGGCLKLWAAPFQSSNMNGDNTYGSQLYQTLTASAVARLRGKHITFSFNVKLVQQWGSALYDKAYPYILIDGVNPLGNAYTGQAITTSWALSPVIDMVVPPTASSIEIGVFLEWHTGGGEQYNDLYFDTFKLSAYETVYSYLNERGLYLSASPKVSLSFLDGMLSVSGSQILLDTKPVSRFVGSYSGLTGPPGYYGREGDLWYDTYSSVLKIWVSGAWQQVAAGGGGGLGTVTAVGLTMPGDFSISGVSGSPPVVHSSGTFGVSWVSQTTNKVFASPNGSSGSPSFRALVNADFPTSGVTANTYQGITVNAQGIITGASNQSYLTGNQSITLSGDATGTGATGIAVTLKSVGTAGTYQSVTTDAQGRVTAGTNPGYITGNQTITLGADLSGSGATSIAASIVAGAVTLAKMANLSAKTFIGRHTNSTGAPEALSVADLKGDLSLNLVENTALSTWAGTASITTVGTIGTGTWNAGSVQSSSTVSAGTQFKNTNSTSSAPGAGGTVVNGDRWIIYDTGTYKYGVGLNGGTVWFQTGVTNGTFAWYQGTTAIMTLSSAYDLWVGGGFSTAAGKNIISGGFLESTSGYLWTPGDLIIAQINSASNVKIYANYGKVWVSNFDDDAELFAVDNGTGNTRVKGTLGVTGQSNLGYTVMGSGAVSGAMDLQGLVYLRSNLDLLNKAASGWLAFATRDTSGLEAVYNIAYVGSLSAASVSTSGTITSNTSILSKPTTWTTAAIAYYYLGDTANYVKAVYGGNLWLHAADGDAAHGVQVQQNTNYLGINKNPSCALDVVGAGAFSTTLTVGTNLYVGATPLDTIHNSGDGYLRLNDSGSYTNGIYTPGVLRVSGALVFDSTLQILNKAANGLLNMGTRDTSGAEVVYNLAYVGTVGCGAITSSGAISGTAITGSGAVQGTQFISTSSTLAAQFVAGDSMGGGRPSMAQIAFGYAGNQYYRHYIVTQHYGGQAASNQIRFYTSDGVQGGVFPTNAILGLVVENGAIATGGVTPLWKLGAGATTTGLTLKTTSYVNVTIDGTAYKLATVN